MKYLALVALVALSGCLSGGGGVALRLDEMDDARFARFEARVAGITSLTVAAVLAEGDVTAETVARVADVLDHIADGSLAMVMGSLVDTLNLEGYGALALRLAALKLEDRLEVRGAYDHGGLLTERGRATLFAVAVALRELLSPPD